MVYIDDAGPVPQQARRPVNLRNCTKKVGVRWEKTLVWAEPSSPVVVQESSSAVDFPRLFCDVDGFFIFGEHNKM